MVSYYDEMTNKLARIELRNTKAEAIGSPLLSNSLVNDFIDKVMLLMIDGINN